MLHVESASVGHDSLNGRLDFNQWILQLGRRQLRIAENFNAKLFWSNFKTFWDDTYDGTGSKASSWLK